MVLGDMDGNDLEGLRGWNIQDNGGEEDGAGRWGIWMAHGNDLEWGKWHDMMMALGEWRVVGADLMAVGDMEDGMEALGEWGHGNCYLAAMGEWRQCGSGGNGMKEC